MPEAPIIFKPGIYTEGSAKDALSRWRDGLNVRWRSGKPEKIRGRQKSSNTAFLGVCRGMKSWVALDGMKYLQIGTTRKLYIYTGGVFTDITPLQDSTSAPFSSAVLNGPFTSAVGTQIITVAHTAHPLTAGVFVFFSGASASPTDGITIAGWYEVLTTATNSYTISSGVTAAHTEAAFGGAAVDYDYQINPGLSNTTDLFGYDSGTFDLGTYDDTGGSSPAVATAAIWHIDTFGELGTANIHGGSGYTWDTATGIAPGNIATIIDNAPLRINILKTDPQFQRLIAFGATVEGGSFDPMHIRTSNRESMTEWAFTDTNTVFTFRAIGGSEIVGAVRTDTQFFVLTDTSANSLAPTYDEFEYAIKHLADGCGLIAPEAADQWNGKLFWMSQNNFYMYDGIVSIVPCDLWTTIFEDLNLAQKSKFRVEYMAITNEFRIYVATAESDEINKMYIWHPDDKWWSIGDFDDTCIISNSEGFSHPYGTTSDGYLWEHETGYDNGSDPMMFLLRSYKMALSNGDKIMQTKTVIPDFKQIIGTANISLDATEYPQSTEIISTDSQEITSTTEYANLRVRGRYVEMEISTSDLGAFVKMGDPSIVAFPHGRRV